MTMKYSKAARNGMAGKLGLAGMLAGGKLQVYTGAQPTNPEDAATGTLLCTYTDAAGAHTAEVRAVGSFALASGASGSVDTITVNGIDILGGAVAFNTSLTQTAADVAAQINRNPKNKLYVATSSGTTVTLTAVNGLGALVNTHAVNGTVTTIALGSLVNMTGGVSAVNGLDFNVTAAGVLTKKTGQTWQGTSAADGVAGWFRYVGPVADAGAADAAEVYPRVDGSIATSGADFNMVNTTYTSGAPNVLAGFTLTQPVSP